MKFHTALILKIEFYFKKLVSKKQETFSFNGVLLSMLDFIKGDRAGRLVMDCLRAGHLLRKLPALAF